jgi:gamma-glutamyl-gamma-aminobutyrate hydrolase PuuD
MSLRLPVLGICRGMQVINVARGGSLHQHLPDVVGHTDHRQAPAVFGDVEVEADPGSLAARIFGDRPTVRCAHHQAIRDLGRGLVPTARTHDGVVEAVELPSARFVLGVQWHPEEDGDQRPFDALVAEARDYERDRSVRHGHDAQPRARVPDSTAVPKEPAAPAAPATGTSG